MSNNVVIGETELTVGQLIKRPKIELILGDRVPVDSLGFVLTHNQDTGSPVTDSKKKTPTLLCCVYSQLFILNFSVKINGKGFPQTWEQPQEKNPISHFPKHVMIITRGTRGDVQPFMALARGMAESLGYLVTIGRVSPLALLNYYNSDGATIS